MQYELILLLFQVATSSSLALCIIFSVTQKSLYGLAQTPHRISAAVTRRLLGCKPHHGHVLFIIVYMWALGCILKQILFTLFPPISHIILFVCLK